MSSQQYNGRDSLVDVAKAIRAAHLQLTRAKNLGAFDRRVLDALVAVVFSYTRLQGTTTATQVAQWVYDLDADNVTGGHRKKVRESLRRLHADGIVSVATRKGRPSTGIENATTVELPRLEMHPGSGVHSSVDDAGNEPQGRGPFPAENNPNLAPKSTPETRRNTPPTGWHTEKYSEKTSEEREADKFAFEDSAARASDLLSLTIEYFGKVNKSVDRDEIEVLVAAYPSDIDVSALLDGCTWPSDVREQLKAAKNTEPSRPFRPPCDRGCNDGWVLDIDASPPVSRRCECNPSVADRQRARERAAELSA
jgi:hypothetical protein